MIKHLIRTSLIPLMAVTCSVYSAPVGNLFSDHRAVRTDDILTVLIVESAKAGSESNTNTSKENSMGVAANGGSGALGFLPTFGANGSSKVGFDGKGGTSRAGNLVATVSARVVKVLDNGNLVIEGNKVVEINDEKEMIKLSGVVRPQDIQTNNIIYSSSIADAQITYAGKGVANTGQRPGILARFINWIF